MLYGVAAKGSTSKTSNKVVQCSLFYSYFVCVFDNNACHVCERSELAYKMLLKRLFDGTLKMDDQFWTVKKLSVVKLIDLNHTFLSDN